MKALTDIQVYVQQRQSLTSEIDCWRLVRNDGLPLPEFRAGAHVEVQIAPGVRRAYSLCSDPSRNDCYEIAVKRESSGRGGSQALHRMAQAESILWISPPRNLFSLTDDAGPHLLVGAGIGLTPLVAMAHSLHLADADFQLIVRVRSHVDMPFAELLNHGPWKDRVKLSYSSEGELQLPQALGHVYCCGPSGFMQAVRARYAELPNERWHQEHFASDFSEVAGNSYRLNLTLSNRQITVAAGQRLIDALREQGVPCETVCEQGVCGSCVVPWKNGQPRHNDECLSAEDRLTYLALCCAGCYSSSLTLEL